MCTSRQPHFHSLTFTPVGCPEQLQESTVGQQSNTSSAGGVGHTARFSRLMACQRTLTDAYLPPQAHLINNECAVNVGCIYYWQEKKAYIMTISPCTPSAVQACCLFSVKSLISPLLRLPSQPSLAAVCFMPWSHTWALGSWYTLKAMSHSRWKCFTLKQGHTKIMAISGERDWDKADA